MPAFFRELIHPHVFTICFCRHLNAFFVDETGCFDLRPPIVFENPLNGRFRYASRMNFFYCDDPGPVERKPVMRARNGKESECAEH